MYAELFLAVFLEKYAPSSTKNSDPNEIGIIYFRQIYDFLNQ